MTAFANLARESDVALVVDETYQDFLPDGHGRPHALFALPDWRDTVVQLCSFSKSYAIPGHRLGAVPAGARMLGEVTEVLDCGRFPLLLRMATRARNGSGTR